MQQPRQADGRLFVVAGASRSGKTAWTIRATRPAGRVFVWDVEDQWSKLPGFRRVTSRAELLQVAQAPGRAKVAFVSGGDLRAGFDYFCQAVYYSGRYVGPLVVVAEELADVTTPAKAPGSWGILLRRGLKRGIDIFALSQRWAEADKTAMGNASEFVIFRQSSMDNVEYLAKKTRVPAADIDALKPLEFVRFDAATREIKRGKVTFGRGA